MEQVLHDKQCTRCHSVKPLAEFHLDNQNRDKHRNICKTCTLAYINRPDVKKRRRAYRLSERGRRAAKKTYLKNREYYLERNRKNRNSPWMKNYLKQYFQTPKGKDIYAKKNARRRANMKMGFTENPLTLEQWQDLQNAFGQKCAYCQRPARVLTRDHIIPISQGGKYEMGNIVPACRSCNSRKHVKPAEDWMKQNGMDWEKMQNTLRPLLVEQ